MMNEWTTYQRGAGMHKKSLGTMVMVIALALLATPVLAEDPPGMYAFVEQSAVFDIGFISQDVHEYGTLEVERIRHTTSTETFRNRTNTTDRTETERGTVYRDIHAHIETFNANVEMNAQAGASVGAGASVASGSVTASGNQQVSMNASQNFSNGGHATINYTGSTTVTATAGQPNPS